MKKSRIITFLVVAMLLMSGMAFAQEADGGPQAWFTGQVSGAYLVRGAGPASLADVGVLQDTRLGLGLTFLGNEDPTASFLYGFDFRFLLSSGSTSWYTPGATASVLFLDWPIRAAAGYSLGNLIVSGFAGPMFSLVGVADTTVDIFSLGFDIGARAQLDWGPYLELAYSAPEGFFIIDDSPTLTNPAGLRVEVGWFIYTMTADDLAGAEAIEPGDI